MKTRSKVIIGGAGALGLGVILAMIGVVGLWNYIGAKLQSPEIRQKNDKGKADGIAFGKTTDQNGCMEKGFLLQSTDDSFDLSNRYFLEKCLITSQPTANFCEGVPLISSGKWEMSECKKIGRENESCGAAMFRKLDYCRSSYAKK